MMNKLGPFELGKVHQGDCLELMKQLPDKCEYTVITDPPYNINFKYNTYKDDMPDDDYIEMLSYFQNTPLAIIQYPEEMMRLVVPALGPPDEVLAWCYNSNINKQFRLINIYNAKVNFKEVKQPYKNPNDKRIKKLIENGSKGRALYDWFSDIQLVKNVSKEKTIHPCPVPVKLFERLILLITKPDDLVIDPFAGCGTMGIACKQSNRKFIGFELDGEYCKVANDRIQAIGKDESGQGSLFNQARQEREED